MTSLQIYNLFLFVILVSSPCIAKKKDKEATKSSELLRKETERLDRAGVTCPQSIVTQSTLDRLRITDQYEKALACHIKYLEKKPGDAWAWSSMGTVYFQQGLSKSSTTCFKSASKLGGKLSEFVRQWHFLGPFVIGKNELDGDPAETYGGIQEAAKKRFNKQERYASELVGDGKLGWLVYKQNNVGEAVTVAPQLNWNDLVNSLGSTAILEWQGWMVGEFAVNDDGLNVIIQCLGVHTVLVDDIPLTGDVYHRAPYWFSASLSRGVHSLYIRVRAKARAQFKCTIGNAHANFKLLKPHYLPDLYDGRILGSHIALPIANYNTKKWLRDIKVTVSTPGQVDSLLTVVPEKETFSIAPGQTRPVRIQLAAASEQSDRLVESCSELNIELRVSSAEGESIMPLSLRCRKLHESFLITFVDHDGSVQQAAIIEPLEVCEQKMCPVLLTLHGTTVPPQSQADSYKYMVDDKYVFGLPHAWILAPTRHGAHNWEGPGALTAIQSLQTLAALTAANDWMTNKASSQHVIFAGHSMGGHGAWELATHLPDRALAVISLAGWIKKEEYGDSNLFFQHDIATTSVDPATKAVLEACITENESDRLASNLQGISVLVRIGSADRTIHPFFTRRMYRVLRHLGVNVTYSELPDKEHWWWDTWETNDGGAVHDPELRKFTNYFSELPASPSAACDTDGTDCETSGGTEAASKYQNQKTQRFTYITTNPAFGETVRGLRVLQQVTPFRTSTIQVEVNADEVQLVTVNVLRFMISEPTNRPVDWWQKNIKVDGQQMLNANVWKDPTICLCKEKMAWKVCSDCRDLESPTERGPSNLGPARRVAERPFLIVAGTQAASASRLLHAAVYIANLFFLTSDTDAPIITDNELTQEVADQYNLIILGAPEENSWTARYLESIPLIFEKNTIGLGSCQFDALSGALFLAPHGRHLALVLMGDSTAAMQDVVSLATPTIPPMTRSPFSNLIPDYVITGPKFRTQGPGGYSCVGFWGNSWDFRPELSSCSYCVLP